MKKIYIIAMSALMLCSSIALSACGSSDTSENSKTPSSTSSSNVSTEDSAYEVETTEAATNEAEVVSETETTNPTEERQDKPVVQASSQNASQRSAPNAAQTYNNNTSGNNSNNTTSRTNNSRNNNTASSTQTRTNSGNKSVTGISLSKNSMTLTEGSSGSFEVNIKPSSATDKQYNVVTNNGNATVSCSGSKVTVYAQHKGNCTITVSSTNGKTAVCNVTVQAKSSSSSNKTSNKQSSGNTKKNSSNSSSNNTKVTDDTLLPRNKLITKANIEKLCNRVNNYFINKYNMKLNNSLNKNNSGWFYSCTSDYYGDYYFSVNTFINREIEAFENDFHGLINSNPQMSFEDIYGIHLRCYYQSIGNGNYDIFLCYQ